MKTVRRIPTEDEITLAFRRLDESPWATILARLLVYGLRPHEAHLGTITEDGLFLVPSHTKTGERVVPPFEKHQGWIRHTTGLVPKLTVKENRDYGLRTYQAFRRKDVPFNPYDCRHRWIVLTEEQGIPPAIAAIWAGHSTKTRYEVYTRTLDQRRALRYAQEHGFMLNQHPNHINHSHQSICRSPSLTPIGL
jgi:hypothetical protein